MIFSMFNITSNFDYIASPQIFVGKEYSETGTVFKRCEEPP